MRTRYISNTLVPDGYPSTPILRNPIFTPLFTAALGTFGSVSIINGITVASFASAIAAGGGYKEFACQL